MSRLFLTKFCPSKYIFHASLLQNTCITNYEKQNVPDNLAKIFRYELYFLLNLLCRSSESIFINLFLTQFVSISLVNNFFLSNTAYKAILKFLQASYKSLVQKWKKFVVRRQVHKKVYRRSLPNATFGSGKKVALAKFCISQIFG